MAKPKGKRGLGIHGLPTSTRVRQAVKLRDNQKQVTIGRRNFVLESWGYDKTYFHSALLKRDKAGNPTSGFVAMSSWGPLDAKIRGVTSSNAWKVNAGVQDAALKKAYGKAVVRWFFGNVEAQAKAKGKKALVVQSTRSGPEHKFLRSMGFIQVDKTEYFVKKI